MLIDTHAHLWFLEYANDLEQVIERAKQAGVEKMIVPGTDIESSKKAVAMAKKYPGVIYASVGVHPEELISSNKVRPSPPLSGRGWALPSRSDVLAAREQVVAIGEIGTDASSEELNNCMGEQKTLFRSQCEMALEHDLPVIIHTRNSFDETWEVLQSLPKMPRGQFHCFSVDEASMKIVLEHGFYVSFCGNITWSKRVARLVPLVPNDRLLLETDSPLMVPRDRKGVPVMQLERNEPANVRVLAEKIAELRGQSLAQFAEITTANAIALFKL